MNTSPAFGSLQAGYAVLGTDTGHQGHPLDESWAKTVGGLRKRRFVGRKTLGFQCTLIFAGFNLVRMRNLG